MIHHFTSTGLLGESLATFWGRNDAVANVVLSRLQRRRNIAVIGGGVYEPITLAASRFLNLDTHIAAYDAATEVNTTLRQLIESAVVVAIPTSTELWMQPSPETFEYLRRVGVDTRLLRIEKETFSLEPTIKRRLTSYCTDLKTVLKEWRTYGQRWDLIICNNVLPNISAVSGRTAVPSTLAGLAQFINPHGAAIIGVIDSQLYKCQHPRALGHFSAEVVRALRVQSQWRIDGWFSRAWVREHLPKGVMLDGYSILVLRRRGVPPLLSDVCKSKLKPLSLPCELRELSETELLNGRIPYVFAAVCVSEREYIAVLANESFPNCLSTYFRSRPAAADISFQICEALMPGAT